MKKLFAPVILLFIISGLLSAQSSRDILYLKNGSSIHGKLLEASANQFRIKTSDGSIFIFSTPEVDKFINEEPVYSGRKKSGVGFVLEAGFLIGPQTSDYKAPFSFNIILNLTKNTRNIFGLGSGVEYLGKSFTPLFIEYKYLFSERKTTPFIFFRGGMLAYLSSDSPATDILTPQYGYKDSFRGGASFAIGSGASWSKDGWETYLSFAYRYAHTSYSEVNYNSQTARYNNAYNRLEIKFGFRF